MTTHPGVAGPARIDRAANHIWALFVDWTRATDTVALPAEPETVAEFLADHPARPATHRRRVSAINAVHRHHGLPEPGRADAVHAALATRRHQRLVALRHIVGELIPHIPITGWPQGLFGRRDGLILTLVAAGFTYAEIAKLQRGDVRRDGDTLFVCGDRKRPIDSASTEPAYSAQAVHVRWAIAQAAIDRFYPAAMLAEVLDRSAQPNVTAAPALSASAATQPLLVSIDRWGYTPLRPTSLGAQSIATIVRAHLSGRPPQHRARRVEKTAVTDPAQGPAARLEVPADLSADYYSRGILARRHADMQLSSVGDALDEVASRAERLLHQLALIVGEPTGS